MNDRVHACLDGELPADELSRSELLLMVHLQQVIEAAASPLRTVDLPDLTERVMQRLPLSHPAPSLLDRLASLGRRAAAWFMQPWSLHLQCRPAFALAGAMAFVLLALHLSLHLSERGPATSLRPGSQGAPSLYVQFRLEASGVSQVALAGSFTEWQPRYQLAELTPGVWTVEVPLAPGVHDYAFVLDSERWVADPHALQVSDDFGGANSRLALLLPAGGA